jgi:hypothetical protein
MNRRILYVDASVKNGICKIALFDHKIDKLDVIEYKSDITSAVAEKYAVLNAALYSVKHNLNRVHILTDHQPAVGDERIAKIFRDLDLTISWIPREINVVADKGTKLDNNTEQSDFRVLDMFYKISMRDENSIMFDSADVDTNNLKQQLENLKKENIDLKNKNSTLKGQLNSLKQKNMNLTLELNKNNNKE